MALRAEMRAYHVDILATLDAGIAHQRRWTVFALVVSAAIIIGVPRLVSLL